MQALGCVPSSIYKSVETLTAENISIADYLTFTSLRLDQHTEKMKTIICNLPPRNKDFTGRELNLVSLEECFSENKPVVLAANTGLGGVGKTQIALQYAYRTAPQYSLIW